MKRCVGEESEGAREEEEEEEEEGKREREREKGVLTWYFEVEVARAAHGGDGGSLSLPGDTLLHPALARHLHRKWTSCVGGTNQEPPGNETQND